MTEQQIKNLQVLLNSSQETQLDEQAEKDMLAFDTKILDAAKHHVVNKKSSYLSRLFDRISVPSFGLINAIALSVMLTLGVLFFLGQLTQLDDTQFLANKRIAQLEKNSQAELVDSESTLILSSIERPVSQNVRDQILLEMKLPDAQILLDEMGFSLTDDRQIAAVAITDALLDIRLMIKDGELNNARQRYEQLRLNCIVCVLPNSLEAVVLNFSPDSNRSS